jgi:hypothetical protein
MLFGGGKECADHRYLFWVWLCAKHFFDIEHPFKLRLEPSHDVVHFRNAPLAHLMRKERKKSQ